jgi:hypothetical protein
METPARQWPRQHSDRRLCSSTVSIGIQGLLSTYQSNLCGGLLPDGRGFGRSRCYTLPSDVSVDAFERCFRGDGLMENKAKRWPRRHSDRRLCGGTVSIVAARSLTVAVRRNCYCTLPFECFVDAFERRFRADRQSGRWPDGDSSETMASAKFGSTIVWQHRVAEGTA